MNPRLYMRSARTRSIAFFEFAMPPRFRVPHPEHAPPHILLMLDGSVREGAGATIEHCRAGDVRYSPAGDRHCVEVLNEGARCLVLEATGFSESGRTERVYLSAGVAARTMAEVRRELFDLEIASPFRAEELALALFATMQRTRGTSGSATDAESAEFAKSTDWLLEAGASVAMSSANAPGVTLGQLAKRVRRHPNVVARAFRARYGVSLGRFHRRRQLHRSWELLADPSIPLHRVASESGFTDQSHFSRVVSRELLQSPQRIRDQLALAARGGAPRGNWFLSHALRAGG